MRHYKPISSLAISGVWGVYYDLIIDLLWRFITLQNTCQDYAYI
jgi:hypothetical protein